MLLDLVVRAEVEPPTYRFSGYDAGRAVHGLAPSKGLTGSRPALPPGCLSR